jgi:hypothetical protein
MQLQVWVGSNPVKSSSFLIDNIIIKDISNYDVAKNGTGNVNETDHNGAQVDVSIKNVSQSSETQDTGMAKYSRDILNQTGTEKATETNLVEQTNQPPKADAWDDQNLTIVKNEGVLKVEIKKK